MPPPRPPHVTSAEILPDGLIIAFDDGRTAMFSDVLLHATLAQAVDLPPDPDDSIDPNP